MTAPSESSAGPLGPNLESRPGLLRVLGPGMAMAIVVGNVIGAGIFAKPGEIAANGGNFPLIIAAWIVGGILCLLGALCFAELAAMLPSAGGLYVYLREAYGRETAFLFGFNEFIFGRPASIGALAMFFVTLGAGVIGVQLSTLAAVQLAIAVIAVMAWVNVMGVIWGGRVQGATTVVKAGFLGAIALLPFALQAAGYESLHWSNYATTVVPKTDHIATQFAAVLLAVLWAYNGWHDVAPVAEEIRDPQKNIPWALLGGVCLLILLYVGVNLAYHAVLSMEQVQAAGEGTAQVMIQTLLAPLGSRLAAVGAGVMSAVIMCSVFGAINSNLLLGPRIAFAMGRDDVFFRQLGKVHVNYRTPAVAIVVQATMSILLVVASGILVEYVERFRKTSIFTLMTDYVIFSASIFYMLCVLGVIILRLRHPEWERPYKTWGYPAVPVIFLASYLWFIAEVYVAKPDEAQTGLVLIAAGLPVFYAWRWWAVRNPQTAGE